MDALRQLLDRAQQAIHAGRMDECVGLLRQAIALAPRDAGLVNTLAVALHKSGRLDQAIESYRAAIELDAQSTETRFNLALCLRDTGRIDEAIEAMRGGLAIDPKHAAAWNDLGTLLWNANRWNEALAAYQKAEKLRPDAPDISRNVGSASLQLGHYDEARQALQRAIAHQPDLPIAHYTLAQVLLAQGDLPNGWREYEWRVKVKHLEKIFDHFPRPQWDGSDLRGKRLLVHDEQGFGDTIQFSRYLPMLKERGAGQVMLLCDPRQVCILKTLEPPIDLIPRGQPFPPYDEHCYLISLPLMFGTTLHNIPASRAYLRADASLVQRWRERMSALPASDASAHREPRRIGLVWAGRAEHRNDRHRSLTLRLFSPLLDECAAFAQFFSLQKGAPAEQLREIPNNVIDWTTDLHDFADTAALIANLDLVISADTAVAHLAGALGKPVWLLLPFVPDWRWMIDREDSPWYPTMRLFRQLRFGEWEYPVQKVVQSLREFKITSNS